ncbi:bifunctional UDP-N-acetylglucosamine diphosphorylase/glucosamine-1-phosphate N-acetyltransferase GlmU [Sneathiella aquimaris]|uniref:bifunctional UDP-N-acetylglucosamine diphosphorylase/glucosamine-1-phosphate N-acetyltransferase GlmU n=1 Tax=Sneathiella aquimaris TaxID=2599305 RepID=UPI00146D8096|nr:bifunctional UDP-N-acetylglucosamine diphosphorylase/glucosamine-1-phosphate N-acetyltransferase GlmU [Sneathiella aquimaris]
MTAIATVILAAGAGSRMKSKMPKVLHQIAGRAMVSHLLDTVSTLNATKNIVVVAPGMDDVRAEVAPAQTAVQKEALGTGHAVAAALPDLEGFVGDILVLYGDTPLITAETLRTMIEARRASTGNAVVVLGFEPEDPLEYGRLVTNEAGDLEAIVEFADATDKEKSVRLCNSGVMAISSEHIEGLISAVGNENAKGEYYLTDIVSIARSKGLTCKVVKGQETELLGVNNRVQLAEAEEIAQERWRKQAMTQGATLIDPKSVFFSHDTILGQDVVVEPNVFFGPGVTISDGVRIKAFSHIEGATVGVKSQVGPYARLRPGAALGEKVKVGNFVEVKKASLDDGAKVSHLSYIGDAYVGAQANIGAGTITCNYDGYDKAKTVIGAGAFVGSNTALVAPVKIGDGAIIGAGSTVTKEVAPDALMVERASETQKAGWAKRFRAMKARLKK